MLARGTGDLLGIAQSLISRSGSLSGRTPGYQKQKKRKKKTSTQLSKRNLQSTAMRIEFTQFGLWVSTSKHSTIDNNNNNNKNQNPILENKFAVNGIEFTIKRRRLGSVKRLQNPS